MEKKSNVTLAEFVKMFPEYASKKKKISSSKMKYLCQCKCSYVFDYRERIKFEPNNPHYAPCQGKCPRCGSTNFSFIGAGSNVYPIKWNFIG